MECFDNKLWCKNCSYYFLWRPTFLENCQICSRKPNRLIKVNETLTKDLSVLYYVSAHMIENTRFVFIEKNIFKGGNSEETFCYKILEKFGVLQKT